MYQALRALPAALLVMVMLVTGCGDKDESPLGPSAETPALPDELKAEKERNMVDLGPASPASLGLMATTTSVSAAGAAATAIPFDPEPGPFAHQAVGCDDCVESGIPIGFSFTFFGNVYTTFNISSNGFIGFSPDMYNGCCSGRRIPSNDGINNIIAAAWTDLYPAGGGGVFYETRGRAPSRYLIVSYSHVPWCCDSGDHVTSQIILYEGSNAIEIHTANQSAGHIYTQGIENANGTDAMFLSGRVAANYGLANDAVRFTTSVGSWASRAPLPSARRGPAVAAANGILYSIGGGSSTGAALNSVVAYNPSSNSWSSRPSLPSARARGNGAVSIGTTLYLAGGFDATGHLTRTLYAFNTSTRTWSSRATMPVASGCGGSAVTGNQLYVFTGCTLTSTGRQIAAGLLHRYNPSTNRWTMLPAAPTAHVNPVVRVIGGKVYIAGGNNASSVQVGRLDVYDPASNTWSTRASMPTARVDAGGAVVGDKLYVIGGRTGTSYLKTVEAYDPVTNAWSPRTAMTTGRTAPGIGVISNLIYAVGGQRSSTTLSAANERFTP